MAPRNAQGSRLGSYLDLLMPGRHAELGDGALYGELFDALVEL